MARETMPCSVMWLIPAGYELLPEVAELDLMLSAVAPL